MCPCKYRFSQFIVDAATGKPPDAEAAAKAAEKAEAEAKTASEARAASEAKAAEAKAKASEKAAEVMGRMMSFGRRRER